ncbi:EscU/YscU/HrcU family type III secretion system export apparatus switch protein [Variovorax sp. J22G73]|jgi:flagellar biosynthesis protein|uniref:EscU/YscU/HrcU family type III secretion system export apparatus switch protein n=1 Tax=unclassified Variovorax TaxID=663243 RepID=UPI000D5C88C4|nr:MULTISPECIES: EscU/YscU/HrcU family type III secretion system export apparatus switch protein [unclassified Variovorax]MDM0007976.1 EscU/YscU/HrcU family type III secretion system export apparatus switch protein [Variovorax sp. J22R203]MDM0100402.1 EscU/YscU/HrcU family type III secretion system export apparatus switch protein [Variovorax sp. J22G73]
MSGAALNEALDDRTSAIALSYADKSKAPVVVAKGYGVAAESIMREARAHGLYVHSSADLVKLLMQVDLDQQIPPQLYLAVAEVMAWLYGLEGRAAN